MGITLRQAWLETKLFVRGLDNLFWTLAFPMFFVALFGLISVSYTHLRAHET